MGVASWEREPTQSDGTLEENWLFRLRRERYRSRLTGKGHDFYILELADAVSVVALTPDRKLVLVRQFRAGSKEDSLETPGGLLEAGEDPCVAGARELAEETGYAGDPPVLLGTVWSNPSLMTSRIATILITNARPSIQPRPDEGEEVAVELVPAADVPRMIADGRIDHALVVAGLLWWLVGEMPGTDLSLRSATEHGMRRLGALALFLAVTALFFAVASRAARSPAGALGILWTGAAFLGLVTTDWSRSQVKSTILKAVAVPGRGVSAELGRVLRPLGSILAWAMVLEILAMAFGP